MFFWLLNNRRNFGLFQLRLSVFQIFLRISVTNPRRTFYLPLSNLPEKIIIAVIFCKTRLFKGFYNIYASVLETRSKNVHSHTNQRRNYASGDWGWRLCCRHCRSENRCGGRLIYLSRIRNCDRRHARHSGRCGIRSSCRKHGRQTRR